jgi:hypothetical protein
MVALSSSRGVVYATASARTLGARLFVCEAVPGEAPKPCLLDRVRPAIAARHYSRRTGKAYIRWIKRYIFFHGKLHGTMLSDIVVQTLSVGPSWPLIMARDP